MARSKQISGVPDRKEQLWGWVYTAFSLLALPTLLREGMALLRISSAGDIGAARLNFCYFAINFLMTILIFRHFLGNNLAVVGRRFWDFIESIILGLFFAFVGTYLLQYLVSWLKPGLSNLNDQAVASMVYARRALMLLGTAVFAPVAEECIYRGLIFRTLYANSKFLAYALSILAFSAAHVLGSVGRLDLTGLLLTAVQYLPAGAALAWSYARGGSIFTPMVIHAIFNLRSYLALF